MHEHDTAVVARIPVVRLAAGAPGHKHTKRYEVTAETVVDPGDEEYLRQFTWLLHTKPNGTRYAQRTVWEIKKQGLVYQHADIWTRHNGPVPEGMTIDHRNRDSLDNRLGNLRLATTAQQGYNKSVPRDSSSGYKGVHYAGYNRFKAFIRFTGDAGRMRFYLGQYPTAEEAAVGYNHAAERLHGEFAHLNNVPEGAVSEERSTEILAIVLDRLTKPVSAQ